MSNEHCGYVVEVKELRKHSNADRLQVATFFGNQTIVDMSVQVGDIGIYFPTDLQLSEEYCAVNNLVRKKDAEGKNIGGYLDPDKRNIRDMKLRNEKSEGLYMPLTSLMEFCKISLRLFSPNSFQNFLIVSNKFSSKILKELSL